MTNIRYGHLCLGLMPTAIKKSEILKPYLKYLLAALSAIISFYKKPNNTANAEQQVTVAHILMSRSKQHCPRSRLGQVSAN